MSDPESTIKQSPLQAEHEALGARMMPFAGWNMPVQYRGIREEHQAVRTSVGVFDISHMGQFFVEGAHAAQWLDSLLTNYVGRLEPGTGQYTLMCGENGGVIDDLIIYCLAENAYFLVVNASMIDADHAWMSARLADGVVLRDESADWAGMAVQGPRAPEIFSAILPGRDLPPRNGIARITTAAGDDLIVCRTGYTGEDGFEFFCGSANAGEWWRRFLENGAEPCGLGARDTLRLEAAYPLNGSDLSPDHTPIEAGLKFFVKLDKGEFVGRQVMARQVAESPPSRLCALKMTGKTPPPRSHYPVLHNGAPVADLSSGTLSPTLNEGIGLAYLPAAIAAPGTELEIEIRGRRFPAVVVAKPFYKRA